MFESPFWEILFGAAVCCIALAFTWPAAGKSAIDLRERQFRARSLGTGRTFDDVAKYALSRAAEDSPRNGAYLRQLKQANWHWALGEVLPPSPRAPFWNLETLWTEKYVSAALYAALGLLLGFMVFTVRFGMNAAVALVPALLSGLAGGYFGFTGPDNALKTAAARRQKAIAVEMGYRLPELRSDVLAGRTIMSAIRELGSRPGGPFVEEMRRVLVAFDVLKDEAAALNLLIERNAGNEMVLEFASQMRMAIQQGNEVNKVLNVLADAAQYRLVQHMNAQSRRNAAEMGRPLSGGSIVILALLVMLPAALSIGVLLQR
jgi:Flp pilus assembly protein TadB